jgi:CBS domain-containing protein
MVINMIATAQTIMDPNPIVLHPTDTIGTAARYILSHRLRHVPVVDEQGRYLGIFGIYSLLRLILPKAATMEKGLKDISFIPCTVEELRDQLHEVEGNSVMTCLRKDIPVVHPDTPLLETVLLLLDSRIALPVVDKGTGRLVGKIPSRVALGKLVGNSEEND